MKTLAAKGFRLMEKSQVAKIAAIAVPMVLVECHTGPGQMQYPRAAVVNIEAPATGKSEEGAGSDSDEMGASLRKEAAAKRELRTELNVDIYENCLLRARLSVINPDGSLGRVILDPKIDFVLDAQASATGAVCSQAWECDVSAVAGASSKYGLQTGIIAAFRPAPGSGLSPSVAAVPLYGEDFRQNCP
jgi:hypothetical protein